ncbi:MAG: Sensor histidine kinase [Marmoricola sp.]|jgi:two-component system OmpR family sensor kinase|nr:Sensor histidine kinase [Marmoricola sp.]
MWRPLPRSVREVLNGRGSLRTQLIALTCLSSTIAVVVLGVLVQLLLGRATDTAVSKVMTDRAASVVASAQANSKGTRISVPQSRLEAGVAVYGADGSIRAGAAPDALADQYDRVRVTTRAKTLRVGDYARVYALPFMTKAGQQGTVVVSEQRAPYATAATYALAVTIGAGILLVSAATGLVAFASRRALRPVSAMAATAEEWSEHDLGRRFALGEPGNEITSLGRTLDGLLDKVAQTIRSEQRLTSELAHELRTPLAAIQGNIDLLRLRNDLDRGMRDDLDEVHAACLRMSQTISGLIDLARATSSVAHGTSHSVSLVVDDALRDATATAEARDIAVGRDIAPDLTWEVPHDLAVRALTPLVTNAARMARTQMRLTAGRRPDGSIGLTVEDDGPGVEESRRDLIFSPGETSGGGAGLGLALSRRIARVSGGDVTLDPSPGPTRFLLHLPG